MADSFRSLKLKGQDDGGGQELSSKVYVVHSVEQLIDEPENCLIQVHEPNFNNNVANQEVDQDNDDDDGEEEDGEEDIEFTVSTKAVKAAKVTVGTLIRVLIKTTTDKS